MEMTLRVHTHSARTRCKPCADKAPAGIGAIQRNPQPREEKATRAGLRNS